MKQTETDPNELLALALGRGASVVNMASFAFINGKIIAFPKSDEAKIRFIAAGYSLESVTPTISGFELNKAGPIAVPLITVVPQTTPNRKRPN